MQLDASETPRRENPYATPNEAPIRSYWSRFGTAALRAWKFYRRQIKRDGITLGEEFRAWCALLFIVGLLTFLGVTLGFAIVRLMIFYIAS